MRRTLPRPVTFLGWSPFVPCLRGYEPTAISIHPCVGHVQDVEGSTKNIFIHVFDNEERGRKCRIELHDFKIQEIYDQFTNDFNDCIGFMISVI